MLANLQRSNKVEKFGSGSMADNFELWQLTAVHSD